MSDKVYTVKVTDKQLKDSLYGSINDALALLENIRSQAKEQGWMEW